MYNHLFFGLLKTGFQLYVVQILGYHVLLTQKGK